MSSVCHACHTPPVLCTIKHLVLLDIGYSQTLGPIKHWILLHTSPGISGPLSRAQPKFSFDSFICNRDKLIQCTKRVSTGTQKTLQNLN